MKLQIDKRTKIYIVAPAGVATGGPELLHQLCYNLIKDFNINAYMYYYPNNTERPVNPAYSKYNNPYVTAIEDIENNLIISPEIFDAISIVIKYKKIRKVLWWLSVDNFFISMALKTNSYCCLLDRLKNMLLSKFKLQKRQLDFTNLILKKYGSFHKVQRLEQLIMHFDYHFAQSYYAVDFLNSIDIKPVFLSDYLNTSFLQEKVDIKQKENIVVYNYAKSFSMTKSIVLQGKGIDFIPIKNMSRDEVVNLLKRAKVYIDFGNHPGKDRLPREAAILGCCIITGKRGSAKYYNDVSIPDEFKFEDKKENIPLIIDKIKECFNNFEENNAKQAKYREIIKNEANKFITDMKKIFNK